MQTFISYSRKDQSFAEHLRNTLRDSGYEVWLDIDKIEPGVYWPDAIDEGLRASDVVVGVISPEAVASRNVRNEWDWALEAGKRLLLLLWRPCTLPHRYVSLNYIDATHDPDGALNTLRNALTDPDRPDYRDDAPAKKPPAPKMSTLTLRHATDRGDTLEQANRSAMIARVQEAWIDGVLMPVLGETGAFEIGMAAAPDAVLRHRDFGDYVFPDTTFRIGRVYDDMQRELLILGAPGSGKTILLLQLARHLLEMARTDDTQPIPVVFNLSSWAAKRLPLKEWIKDELRYKYQTPESVAQGWVNNEQILPLLDGLDEVAVVYREQCVEAINTFRTDHLLTDMVVCSRVADYEALSNRLDLLGAITLSPLTDAQIETYLDGPRLATLRATMKTDDVLQRLARTPFLLNTMAQAYQDATPVSLSLPTGEQDEDGRMRHLFDAYVEDRLRADTSKSGYTPSQTITYLRWLAAHMVADNQTTFFIENLQPDWLDTVEARLGYRWRVGVAVSLTLTAIILSAVALMNTALFFSFRASFGGLSGAEWWVLLFVILFGVTTTAIGAVLTGISAAAYQPRLRSVERLQWRITWRGMFLVVVGSSLGAAVMYAVATVFVTSVDVDTRTALHLSGRVWLLFALIIGVESGLRPADAMERRVAPNQGIRRSATNAVFYGLLIAMPASMLVVVAAAYAARQIFDFPILLPDTVSVWMGFSLALGGVLGIGLGGEAVLKHTVLRRMLRKDGHIPRDYAHFLDYAANDLHILRKVGGGYIFRHRYLQEYFANRKLS